MVLPQYTFPYVLPSLIGLFAILALIDIFWRIVPNVVTLPGIVAGLVWGEGGWLGFLVGFVPIFLCAYLYHRGTGDEGIGGGDVKALGMLGAWIGWSGILLVQTVAAVLCLVTMFRVRASLPFVPFIFLGLLAYWIVLEVGYHLLLTLTVSL